MVPPTLLHWLEAEAKQADLERQHAGCPSDIVLVGSRGQHQMQSCDDVVADEPLA
jgi:hypothetical protein